MKHVFWDLVRVVDPDCPFTRGTLHAGVPSIITAELPWKNNERDVSCIVEGTYPVVRHPDGEDDKLRIMGVPGRSLINIEVFNDPLKESRGCIAPGLSATEDGVSHSRKAMKHLIEEAHSIWNRGDKISLSITWAAEKEKDKEMNLVKEALDHRSLAKIFVDQLLPSAEKEEADKAANVIGEFYQAWEDAQHGRYAALGKDIETLAPEIESALASAEPKARKLWGDIKNLFHRHKDK